MKTKWKILVRAVGALMTLKGYYLVFTEGHYPVFHSVLVSDWSMYLLPLSSIFLAEMVIVSTILTRNKIMKQKESVRQKL